jgi:peptidoglycan/xylan/chitin deacetylase (PgdA/CDA1 family)
MQSSQPTRGPARRGRRALRRPARRRGRVRLAAAALVAAAAFAAAGFSLHHAGAARAAGAGDALQVGALHVGAAALSSARPEPVPILVYHHVQSATSRYPLLNVRPWEFKAQLRWLKVHHYHPVTLGTVYDAWAGKVEMPRRPVILSFDDGYVEQYTTAARMLARFHWPGVLNLVVYRGTLLSNAMVRKMIKHGWEVVSHSLHHPVMTRLSSAGLRRELVGSRKSLAHSLNVKVRFFCYPYGIYDRRVEAAARRAGYEAAMSTRYAAATPRNMYALARIYCYQGESLTTFGQRLRRTVDAARAGVSPGRDVSGASAALAAYLRTIGSK